MAQGICRALLATRQPLPRPPVMAQSSTTGKPRSATAVGHTPGLSPFVVVPITVLIFVQFFVQCSMFFITATHLAATLMCLFDAMASVRTSSMCMARGSHVSPALMASFVARAVLQSAAPASPALGPSGVRFSSLCSRHRLRRGRRPGLGPARVRFLSLCSRHRLRRGCRPALGLPGVRFSSLCSRHRLRCGRCPWQGPPGVRFSSPCSRHRLRRGRSPERESSSHEPGLQSQLASVLCATLGARLQQDPLDTHLLSCLAPVDASAPAAAARVACAVDAYVGYRAQAHQGGRR